MLIEKCPVCETESYKNKLVATCGKGTNDIKIMQCRKCCLFYHYEYFNKEELKKFYENHYAFSPTARSITTNFQDEDHVSEELIKKYSKVSYRRFGNLLNEIPNHSKVLEIGCGAGGAIRFLKNEKNCDVTACEPNKIYSNYLNSLGLNVLSISFDDFQIEENNIFDFVLLGDVLEHLLNPVEVINKVKKFLKNEGKLLIATPLAPSGLVDFMNTVDTKKYNFQVAHFAIYNPESLSFLLINISGFSKIINKTIFGDNRFLVE